MKESFPLQAYEDGRYETFLEARLHPSEFARNVIFIMHLQSELYEEISFTSFVDFSSMQYAGHRQSPSATTLVTFRDSLDFQVRFAHTARVYDGIIELDRPIRIPGQLVHPIQRGYVLPYDEIGVQTAQEPEVERIDWLKQAVTDIQLTKSTQRDPTDLYDEPE